MPWEELWVPQWLEDQLDQVWDQVWVMLWVVLWANQELVGAKLWEDGLLLEVQREGLEMIKM